MNIARISANETNLEGHKIPRHLKATCLQGTKKATSTHSETKKEQIVTNMAQKVVVMLFETKQSKFMSGTVQV